MGILKGARSEAKARRVIIRDNKLTVDLFDGRAISVPLAWFPRLLQGSRKERAKWRLIGRGQGIHWPDLDENISVRDLLSGKASRESEASFQKWVKERGRGSRRRP
ncbi:MAG TPA: DUF2442 domain-containing protein [Acidobacteriota bacterium]|jgi:hypothetical protein